MKTYTLEFIELLGGLDFIKYPYEVEAESAEEANKHIEAIEAELKAEYPDKTITYDRTTSR